MEGIKTVFISTAPLPYLGISSWTTEMNYLLNKNNEIDYVIGPISKIKIEKPKQIVVKDKTIIDKLYSKLDYSNRFNNYIRALKKVLKLEENIILQVKDNFGLLKSILLFIDKYNLRNRIYVQYHYHSFSPFTNDEKVISQIDELVLLTITSYKQIMDKVYSFPVRVTINNDGVDSKKFKPINSEKKKIFKESLGIDSNKIIFTWCSQDRKKKGLDLILEAWEKVYSKNKDIQLLVFGVEKEIFVKGVKIMGLVSNDNLIKYYQLSDFYLFPTIWHEGFGLSLVEALKCGCYCISAKNGSTSYVLNNGAYGKLIEQPNIINEWVKCIQESIKEYTLNNKENIYLKNIPQKIYDIEDWYLRYNNNIKEAKKSFYHRYYLDK